MVETQSSDPNKRPTAREAFERFQAILDREVPRRVKLFEDWAAKQREEEPSSGENELPCPSFPPLFRYFESDSEPEEWVWIAGACLSVCLPSGVLKGVDKTRAWKV